VGKEGRGEGGGEGGREGGRSSIECVLYRMCSPPSSLQVFTSNERIL
jgi:hypothetical protein